MLAFVPTCYTREVKKKGEIGWKREAKREREGERRWITGERYRGRERVRHKHGIHPAGI